MNKPSAGHDDVERVATPARYNELVAAFAGAACWLVLLVTNGPLFGLQTLWLVLIALGLGAWSLLRRLRFSRSSLRITLGPWSRVVDMTQLESIRWKDNTVGVAAAGTLYLRDRSGHRAPIEVGRFKRGDEWAPLLLEAAAACGATVDRSARKILERGSRMAPSPGPEKGFTWKHLWGFPGFGFLAALSIVALPVALALIAHGQTPNLIKQRPSAPRRRLRCAVTSARRSSPSAVKASTRMVALAVTPGSDCSSAMGARSMWICPPTLSR